MRYSGNVVNNLMSAAKSQDKVLIKELLVDAMANMIENDPKEMIKTLRHSKVDISENASTSELIKVSSYNLHNNPIFQKNLAVAFTSNGDAESSDYAEAEGGSEKGGLVSSIADMVGSISQWGQSSNDLKKEEERTKARMYEKIFGDNKPKTNWLPIVAIAGVLLIGGIVVWRVTSNK